MFCPNCGAQNADQAAFCFNCGGTFYPQQPVAPVNYAPTSSPMHYGPTYAPPVPVPGYVAPVHQQPAKTPGIGLGVTSMILGILSLMTIAVRGYWFSVLSAIVGIILASVGMSQAKRAGKTNGMAIAGLVCSIVSLACYAIIIFFVFVLAVLIGNSMANYVGY